MLEESDFRTGLNKHPNFLEAKKNKGVQTKEGKAKRHRRKQKKTKRDKWI